MFVGYPHNHASDTFQMWDPRSKRVHITRDVIRLNKMFFPKLQDNLDTNVEYMQDNAEFVSDNDDEDNSDGNNNINTDVEREIPHDNTTEVSNQLNNDNSIEKSIKTTTKSGRLSTLPKKSITIS